MREYRPMIPRFFKETGSRSFTSWRKWTSFLALLGLLMSGTARLFPEWLGARLDPQVLGYLTWSLLFYFLLMLFVLNPWSMWDECQLEIAALKERTRPKLRIVCGRHNPFIQLVSVPQRGPSRVLRVGIRNESEVVIEKARVVIQTFELLDAASGALTENTMIPVEHAMRVMGSDAPNGSFDVSPSDRPTVYVDLAVQATPFAGPPSKITYLPYAGRDEAGVNAKNGCLLTLRVEGGGTSRTKTLLLKGGEATAIELIESKLDATMLEVLGKAARGNDWVTAAALSRKLRDLAEQPLDVSVSDEPSPLDILVADQLIRAVSLRATKNILESVQSLT